MRRSAVDRSWPSKGIDTPLMATPSASPSRRSYIARWNGSQWQALEPIGLNNTGLGLAVLGNDLYASGNFTLAGGVPQTRGVARWDGRLIILLELEQAQVECIAPDVGGGFGVKIMHPWPEEILIPWAAMVLGREVKWTEDRREHFIAATHERAQHHVVRVGFDDDGRIMVMDGALSRAETCGLIAAADCFISLHRSEGFGLGIAEAMALGKPVIATRYSGPADFLTPANSYPVEYQLVPISRDHGPYLEGFTWAEPDIAQASRLMRHVVDNRGESAERGRRAAADIAELRSPERTGAHARKRLEAIWQGSG